MLFLEQLSDRIVPASVAFDGVGNLVVTGDATADHIIITAHNNNDVSVLINSISYGTFNVATPGARLIVFGGSGNDVVNFQGASLPQFSIEEHGGDGNDTLYGGSLNDVLYGDAGNDNLNGGLGADVLVGGAGIDLLTGNAGDDILIGGEVMHFPISTGPGDPSSYDFLVAVRADWLANHDEHSLLVDQLVAQTVDPANSANVDRLIGGSGANLYVHASNDILFGFSATNGDRERLV